MIITILENIAISIIDATRQVVDLILYLKALEEENDLSKDMIIKQHTLTRDKENDTFTLCIYDYGLETYISISKARVTIMVYTGDSQAYNARILNNTVTIYTAVATYYYNNPQALQA